MSTHPAAFRARAAFALAKAQQVHLAQSDDARVHDLIQRGGAALAALAALLAGGQITKAAFVQQATAQLGDGLTKAGTLGGGDALDTDSIDGLLDDRADYLDGYADDVVSGDLSVAQIAQRAALWAGLGWTAYQMGKGDKAEAGGKTAITWVLDPAAHHCDDCPDLAEGSPYTEDTLPTYPGDDVACGGNCFPGDTKVMSPDIEKSYARRYEGALFEIHTAAGRKLAGTPNHPVLTTRGWVALQCIQPGDSVLCRRRGQEARLRDPDIERMPSTLREVHDTLAMMFPRQRLVGAHHQFHGDGRQGYVDVITTNRTLRDRGMTPFCHPLLDLQLATADEISTFLPGMSAAGQRFLRFDLSASSNMRSSGEAAPFVGAGVRHAQGLRFTPIARRNADAHNRVRDGLSADARISAQLIDGFPGQVAIGQPARIRVRKGDVSSVGYTDAGRTQLLTHPSGTYAEALGGAGRAFLSLVEADEVVRVGTRQFRGHVYNLQTRTAWYIANDIVAHNCRCHLEFSEEGAD